MELLLSRDPADPRPFALHLSGERSLRLALGTGDPRLDPPALRERVLREVLLLLRLAVVLPAIDDPVGHRVRDVQRVPELGALRPHDEVLHRLAPQVLVRPQRRRPHHAGERGPGEVVPGEPALHEPRAVVAHHHLVPLHHGSGPLPSPPSGSRPGETEGGPDHPPTLEGNLGPWELAAGSWALPGVGGPAAAGGAGTVSGAGAADEEGEDENLLLTQMVVTYSTVPPKSTIA